MEEFIMNKIILVLILIVMNSFLFAATGWFNDFLTINSNIYWIGSDPGSGTELDGSDFGTVTSLTITAVDMKYWSDSQDRGGGAFYYQIRNASDEIVIDVTETIWSQSYLSGNDYQGTWSGSIDLLDGLDPNIGYKLHIWAKSWDTGSGQGDSWLSNGGDNYVADFKVDAIEPENGDGSSSSPYEIASLANLYWISQNSSVWDKYFEQTADIDAAATSESSWDSGAGWEPIGNGTTAFTGVYNGQEYKIENLYIARPDEDYIGLFGRMVGSRNDLAELKNIVIEKVDISGRSGVGALLGKIDDNLYVVITRCSVVGGTSSWRTVEGYRTTGGLIGANNGYPNGNPAKARSKVYECFANVDVSYRYESGESRTAEKFGGLVGCNQRGETYDSYALGDVNGDYDDGGTTRSAERIGGLAGCVEQGLVERCFSAGEVSGSDSKVGGLTGNITGAGTGGVIDSYWDTSTSNQSSSYGGTGKTTTEMQTATAFPNWNTNIWTFASGEYPVLDWNPNYTLDDVLTFTNTLIFQYDSDNPMDSDKGFYENSSIGNSGEYLAFKSANNETSETYLIYGTYSTDTSLDELSSFSTPENLGAYCKFCFQDQTPSDVNITSLDSDSYFYFQISNEPGDIWYRYNGGNWQKVNTYTDVSGGDQPDYTYKIVIDDLNLSRAGTNCIEFAGDKGGDSPLPVTLSTFEVNFVSGDAIIRWITQSEVNNQYWNIYRSISTNLGQSIWINDGETIDGQGTTTEPTEYFYCDPHSLQGNAFYWYWIESVALNGDTELFGPVELNVPEGGGNDDPPIPPEKYGLYQNFPNPFNPTTAINFALEIESKINLTIYNPKGQKIKSLLTNFFVPANELQMVVWDGKNDLGKEVPSGLYFYKLETENKNYLRKMLLIK